jgi:hypothetical protein
MYAMRTGPHGAEYLLASGKELKLSHTRETITAAIENGEYGVLKRVGEFALLKRGVDTSQNAQLLMDWGLQAWQAPQTTPPPASQAPQAPQAPQDGAPVVPHKVPLMETDRAREDSP